MSSNQNNEDFETSFIYKVLMETLHQLGTVGL